MSRAMNLNATKDEVMEVCAKLGIGMTAIEKLLPQGTRVVCKTSEGAVALRTKFKQKLIEGAVTRSPRQIAPSALR